VFSKVWELETGAELATLHHYTARVRACAVTPDGRRVVSASPDNTLKVWDLETGHSVETVYGAAPFLHVAITPGGMICAGDSLGNVWMMDYALAVEKRPKEEGRPLRLFFSYSHKDEEFRDALENPSGASEARRNTRQAMSGRDKLTTTSKKRTLFSYSLAPILLIPTIATISR